MTIGKLNVDNRVYRFCTINSPYCDKSALVNMVYGYKTHTSKGCLDINGEE